MTGHELETVLAWHEALNAGDAERVTSLSHHEVEIGGPTAGLGPRPAGSEGLGRPNVRLEPLRSSQRGETVVVEEAATWRDAQTGETTGAATIARVFQLDGGLVAGIFRYDGLEDALRRAGPDESDEIRPEPA